MKISFLLLFILMYSFAHAQFRQDVALERAAPPQVLFAPTATSEETPVPKKAPTTAKTLLTSVTKKLAKKAPPAQSSTPQAWEKMGLQAERLNDEKIRVQWNAPVAGRNTIYVIERRFGDPHGPFDSVGMVIGRSTDPATQAYRLVDTNPFEGTTFYRLRETGASDKNKAVIMVNGYNPSVQVTTAPALAGTLTITLDKFKIAPHTHLYITDAFGNVVYKKKDVFFTSATTIQLTGLLLPKGTYQLEVVNTYNSAVNTMVVR